jgi:phosphoribosylformylglycinamidine synthase
MGDDNTIITVHDVGAGGLSNALPELVHDSSLGAVFDLRAIPNAEPGLSPLEIWCNEAQERYVLGIAKENIALFTNMCEREHCLFAIVGETTAEEQLVLNDSLFNNQPVNLPMATLFGKPPKMVRETTRRQINLPILELSKIKVNEAVERVLHLPSVGSKKFLITIGDRSVGGLVTRDQMIGPWQVPVSDVAVTAASFDTDTGEAFAIGERAPLALVNAPASARMAVGEAITNIISSDIEALADIKLSANWMAAAGFEDEDTKLFDAVRAVGEDFCPALGLTIPVGKDSLSMRTVWKDETGDKSITGPLSVVITAFAPVESVRGTLTPELITTTETQLILVDLGQGGARLGGSALAQVYNQLGNEVPDVDPRILREFFTTLQALRRAGKILAYHDRSDGGLLTTLCEMAFAGRSGLSIDLGDLPGTDLERLFNEELGAVLQVETADVADVLARLQEAIGHCVYVVGHPTSVQQIVIKDGERIIYKNDRAVLESWWSDTSYQLQRLRDNSICADEEYASIASEDPGMSALVTAPLLSKHYSTRPKVAIFREQGVNGQVEMAAAFDRAGFTSVDVHLNDILSGRVSLTDFVGLAACGGFSYGDVLGAGEGWAKSILLHPSLRIAFSDFFARKDTFSFGVCNGCQMLSQLKELIPGAENWPTFLKNTSEQFEARLATVRINESPSIFFRDMAGSYLPVPVAHGEGRVHFKSKAAMKGVLDTALVPMQYVDNYHVVAHQYPANPNGSAEGITAVTTPDGRATILMPHPERAFMTRQLSWSPDSWDDDSPWLRIFQNARRWVEDKK